MVAVGVPLEATFLSKLIFPEFICLPDLLSDFLLDLLIVKNSIEIGNKKLNHRFKNGIVNIFQTSPIYSYDHCIQFAFQSVM